LWEKAIGKEKEKKKYIIKKIEKTKKPRKDYNPWGFLSYSLKGSSFLKLPPYGETNKAFSS